MTQPNTLKRPPRKRSREKRTPEQVRDLRVRLLWTIPGILLAILVLFKTITASSFATTAQSSFERQQHLEAIAAADQLGIANVYERWVAPFNAGSTRLPIGDYDGARSRLEEALELTPAEPDRCLVLANLSLAIEGQGNTRDDMGDRPGAEALWNEALALIDGAPPSCFPEDPEGSGESMENTRERLTDALTPTPTPTPTQTADENGSASPTPDPTPPPGGGGDSPNDGRPTPTENPGGDGDQTPEEELQDRLDESNEDQLDQERDNSGGGGFVDKPW